MRLKLSTIGQTLRAIPRLVAELNSREFTGPSDFTLEDFESEITSTMTLANITCDHARYMVVGNMAYVDLFYSLDLSVAAGATISATIPVTPRFTTVLTCDVDSGAGMVCGTASIGAQSNKINITRYDRTNWTLGAGRYFIVKGWVEI